MQEVNPAGRPGETSPVRPHHRVHGNRGPQCAWLALLLVACGLASAAETEPSGQTDRVSVASSGEQGRGDTNRPALSYDGRFVAFESSAANLVARDTNRASDIFVHDRVRRTTTRISVDSDGRQANGASSFAAISGNGRFIAFVSSADNLVPDDGNETNDIFVHDRVTHRTERVSIDSNGVEGNDVSYAPSLSSSGRIVAFTSHADNLVPGDANRASDVFIHDRVTHLTTRVSVDSAGIAGNKQSSAGMLSASGRWVAFLSYADNLAPNDLNNTSDVLVHDRVTGETTRVSVDSLGNQANAISAEVALSADGRFVVFQSAAGNLVPDDTNATFDIFVHDRDSHQTTRVTIDSAGIQGNAYSFDGTLSADGRLVTFGSWATNLDPSPRQSGADVFIHDRQTSETRRVSASAAGIPGNASSGRGVLSADGRLVAFESAARNLVPGDTNRRSDVFVTDRLSEDGLVADVALSQTALPAPFDPLAPVIYTLTLANHGPDAANDVTLVDYPPSNARLLSVIPSQGQCSEGAPLVCHLGSVDTGETLTVTLTVQPDNPRVRRLINGATINSAPRDPATGNNTATLRTDAAP